MEACEPYKEEQYTEVAGVCKAPDYINICYFSFNHHKEYHLLNSFLSKVQKLAKIKKKVRAIEWLPDAGDANQAFRRMVGSGVKCHALVISGHHTGSWGGHRARNGISLGDVENFSCDKDNTVFFQNLRYVWLQGCRTLGQETGVAGAERDLVTFNAERVARDLDIDGLGQLNQFRLQQDYADIFDSENPYSSRLNRTFESANLFGWTMTAPGEKANSEHSMLFHLANSLMNFEKKTGKAKGLIENPLKIQSPAAAQRYYDFIVQALDGADTCQDCWTTGWMQHGNIKNRYALDNQHLNFLRPLKYSNDPLLKSSREIDCKLRHSKDTQEMVDTLHAAMRDPRLASLTLHSVREIVQRSDQYGRPALERAMIKTALRNAQALKQLLFIKLTSPHIGLVRKLEHYAFYVDITKQRLPDLENLMREKAIHFFRNTTDTNADRAASAKDSLLSELKKLDLVNNEMLLTLVNDSNAMNKEVAIGFVLSRWPKAMRAEFKQPILQALQSNLGQRFNQKKIVIIYSIMREMSEWLTPDLERALVENMILAYEANPTKAEEFSRYNSPNDALTDVIAMAQIDWPTKMDLFRRIMIKSPAREQARIFALAVKNREDALADQKDVANALKGHLTDEARGFLVPGIAVHTIPKEVFAIVQTSSSGFLNLSLETFKDRSSDLVTAVLSGAEEAGDQFNLLEQLWQKVEQSKLSVDEKSSIIQVLGERAWSIASVELKTPDRFIALARKHMNSVATKSAILSLGATFFKEKPIPEFLLTEAFQNFDFNRIVSEPAKPEQGWGIQSTLFAGIRQVPKIKYIPPFVKLMHAQFAKHTRPVHRRSMASEIHSFCISTYIRQSENVDASDIKLLLELVSKLLKDDERFAAEMALHVRNIAQPESKKWFEGQFKALQEIREKRQFELQAARLLSIARFDGPTVKEAAKFIHPLMFAVFAVRGEEVDSFWEYFFRIVLQDGPSALVNLVQSKVNLVANRSGFYEGALNSVCGYSYSGSDKQQICPAVAKGAIEYARTNPVSASLAATIFQALNDEKMFLYDDALAGIRIVLSSPKLAEAAVISVGDLSPTSSFNRAKLALYQDWLVHNSQSLAAFAARVRLADSDLSARVHTEAFLNEIDRKILEEARKPESDRTLGRISNLPSLIGQSTCMPCKVEVLRWFYNRWEADVRKNKLDKDDAESLMGYIESWKLPPKEAIFIASRMLSEMEALHASFDDAEISGVTSALANRMLSLLESPSVRGVESLPLLEKLRVFALLRLKAYDGTLTHIAKAVIESRKINPNYEQQLDPIFEAILEKHNPAALIETFVQIQIFVSRHWVPPAKWLEKILAAESTLETSSLANLLALALNFKDPAMNELVDRLWSQFENRRQDLNLRVQVAAMNTALPVPKYKERMLRLLRSEVEKGYAIFHNVEGTASASPIAILIRAHGANGIFREEIIKAVEKMKGSYRRHFEELALAMMLSPEPLEERRKWVDFALGQARAGNAEPTSESLMSRQALFEELKPSDRVWFVGRLIRHYAPSQIHGFVLWDLIHALSFNEQEKEYLLKEYERLF